MELGEDSAPNLFAVVGGAEVLCIFEVPGCVSLLDWPVGGGLLSSSNDCPILGTGNCNGRIETVWPTSVMMDLR